MSATPQFSTWVINHFFRQNAVAAPTGLYLALFTVRPNQDGTGGVEVAGGSYARQEVVLSAPDTIGTAFNSAAIDFVSMPACTVVAGGLYTELAAGVLMQHERFSVPRAVVAGKTFTVPVGDVVVRIPF